MVKFSLSLSASMFELSSNSETKLFLSKIILNIKIKLRGQLIITSYPLHALDDNGKVVVSQEPEVPQRK